MRLLIWWGGNEGVEDGGKVLKNGRFGTEDVHWWCLQEESEEGVDLGCKVGKRRKRQQQGAEIRELLKCQLKFSASGGLLAMGMPSR